MKDEDLFNYTHTLPASENWGDAMLPPGCSENDDYFEGEDADGAQGTFTQPVAVEDKPDVGALLEEIEAGIPDEVLELFGERKKKSEAA